MADGSASMLAKTVSSINDINAAQWNRLANPDGAPYYPFVDHAFLSALEDSKSVAPETGWAPMHLVLEDAGDIIGVTPLYAKGHSQGEYVFDHHWADAYERAGGSYYPKLLSAIPFTPVTGPRLLANTPAAKLNLSLALRQITEKFNASSAHVNFVTGEDKEQLSQAGYLIRMGEQYRWRNREYNTYDDFLSILSSRKRKTLRRERREAVDGLKIRHLRGTEITEAHWDAFWGFYQDTSARKWGYPYLTRTFFRLLAERMPQALLLIVAERNNTPVAGALNLIGGDAIYGRYWGCTENVPFLHFELCYHQAIDYAIAHGLSRVEAGAQGEHKIARGYEPVPTWSAHWIPDDGFRGAIERYLDVERTQTDHEIKALQQFTPFRKDRS